MLDMTDPDWEPIMKKASAIVTNRGGRTCRTNCSEMGVPAVVGSHNATEVLREGKQVTVSCVAGEVGHVYEGVLKFKVTETAMDSNPETKANS